MRTRDENKESAIRQKAIEMIVDQGFDGLSRQKLAKAANVSPATIYIYFQDREDLIMNLTKQVGERMVDATLKDFSADMSFRDGMRVQWKNRAKYWLENPKEAQFLELIKHTHYHEKFGEQIKEVFVKQMGQFVANAITKGDLRPISKEVFWSVAYAPLYQLVKYQLSGKGLGGTPNFVLTDEMLDQTLSIVLKGLKP